MELLDTLKLNGIDFSSSEYVNLSSVTNSKSVIVIVDVLLPTLLGLELDIGGRNEHPLKNKENTNNKINNGLLFFFIESLLKIINSILLIVYIKTLLIVNMLIIR